jgi:hypothetical protein
MSDIGRLFQRVGTALQSPIENFTTEALAIAIDHDDAPIRRALKSIVWPTTSRIDAEHLARVEATTQHYLPGTGSIREGFLDLVLVLTFDSGAKMTGWVEVKVDSPENGGQLDVYADHAQLQTPAPVIITLSKTEVRPSHLHPKDCEIGWLSWRSLAAAIEADGTDDRWRDLLDFLRERQLAWPPMPRAVVDPNAFIPVLLAVNNRIRELWPTYGMAWLGVESGALKAAARAEYSTNNRITVSGGPLTYGLVPLGDEWAWSLCVGSANYQGVPLDPTELVRQAERSGLSERWKRLGHRHTALEACLPLEECSANEEVVAWFIEALSELDERKILASFLDGVDAKRSKSAPWAAGPAGTAQVTHRGTKRETRGG